MSYVQTYWNDCDVAPEYNSAECPELEFGKVRSAAFIRKRYLPSILAAPADPTVWQAGVNLGHIIIIPFVSGSFDPGEPVALKGYGRRLYTRGPRTMVLSFSDPAYVLNYPFYNKLHTRTDFVPVFRTSSVLHIADAPADLFARNVVDEDLQASVVWETKCTWRSTSLPILTDASALGSLFHQSPRQSTTIYFASGHSVTLNATLVIRYEVGAPGAPLSEGDELYNNPLVAGKKVLVLASGLGLPVDDGSGAIDWSNSLVRHIEKTDASDTIRFVGSAPNGEIHEIYTLS